MPKGHCFGVAGGEVLVGQFADPEKRDSLVFAKHNPYESRDVKPTLAAKPKAVELADRAAKKWGPLKPEAVAFKVEDHGVELVRVTR